MRKTNTFKIEGFDKQFTVKELTVKEIIGLIQDDVLKGDTDVESLRRLFTNRVLPLTSNAELADLELMAPSELQEFWDKFAEVNKVFFVWARKAGLNNITDQIKSAVLGDFGKLFANLLKPDTSAV